MPQQDTANLVFHFEADGNDPDVQAIREAVAAELGRAEGVEGVSAEALDADRLIDPVTVGGVIVTVTVAVKGATSLVDALNDLVESVKRLGTTLGVKAWMENRHKRVTIDAEADSRAVAEAAAAAIRSKAQAS
ncbi:MAG TPA: hypothetical protein VMU95_11450 [Trebonia sp.]|nr:hypothetical protein [Trebonia sp.]